MVIIKAYPPEDDYLEAENEFLRAIGNCVNVWAFVDRRLFQLFKFALKTPAQLAAAVYYKQKTLTMRFQMTDDLMKQCLDKAELESEWKPISKLLEDLVPTRNIIVHSPIKRTGTSDGTKAIYVHEIYIEPYEQLLDKEHKGMRGKTALGIDDLKQHAKDAEVLEKRLHELVIKLRAIS